MRDRDITDDVSSILVECGRNLKVSDICEEIAEGAGIVKKTIQQLEERGEVAVIRDTTDWDVRLIYG